MHGSAKSKQLARLRTALLCVLQRPCASCTLWTRGLAPSASACTATYPICANTCASSIYLRVWNVLSAVDPSRLNYTCADTFFRTMKCSQSSLAQLHHHSNSSLHSSIYHQLIQTCLLHHSLILVLRRN